MGVPRVCHAWFSPRWTASTPAGSVRCMLSGWSRRLPRRGPWVPLPGRTRQQPCHAGPHWPSTVPAPRRRGTPHSNDRGLVELRGRSRPFPPPATTSACRSL